MTESLACCAGCNRAQMDGPGHNEDNNTEQQDMGEDLIWFQSSVSVKGLTETSSQPVDVGGFM